MSKSVRKLVTLPPETMERIAAYWEAGADERRFGYAATSESEVLRRLIILGLEWNEAEATKDKRP